MLPIQLQLNTGSPEPLYRQLMDQLKRRVAAGQWVGGQELPSVRELADELTVHPMTISKAYSLLESEGWLARRRGLPMVIAATHQRAAPGRERIEQLRPTLQRAVDESRELGISPAQALSLFQHLLTDDSGSPA